jgi:hypothetical protein
VTREQAFWFWKGYRVGRLHAGRLTRRLTRFFEDEFAGMTEAEPVEGEEPELAGEPQGRSPGIGVSR